MHEEDKAGTLSRYKQAEYYKYTRQNPAPGVHLIPANQDIMGLLEHN